MLGIFLGGTLGLSIGAATSDEIDVDRGIYPNPGSKAFVYGFKGALAGGLLGAVITPKYKNYSFTDKTKEAKIKTIAEKLLHES